MVLNCDNIQLGNGFHLARWGKVLASSRLKKKGFHLASNCPFCGRKEDELEHILSTFGASWAAPLLVKDLLLSWMHFPVRKKVKALWRATPLILFWAIGKKEIKSSSKMLFSQPYV